MRFWSEFIWLLRRLEAVKTALIGRITTAVNDEATARQNADTTLQNNINAEATARTNADSNLDKKIDNRIYVQSGTPTTSASDPIPEGSFWFHVVS